MPASTRRAVLASLATAGLSGCLSLNPLSRSPERSKLGILTIGNRHVAAHVVDLRVEWDGELVHDRTYDLPADDPDDDRHSGAVPERTWPEEPGQFTVSARKDDGAWRTVDPADRGYPDCFAIAAQIEPDDRLVLWVSENEHECSAEAIEAARPTTTEGRQTSDGRG